MARLDTQINQIYYLPATASQVALILHDETLSYGTQLFLIANLVKMAKKPEAAELKKISELILNIFHENKKLTGEGLFETSLAQINQSLADLAHEGKKSWIGKFSALIVLRSNDNIYLANSGQMSALLYRNNQFLQILESEKLGSHPLKIFSNFTTGKLKTSDLLLLTTANLFNYIALQNLQNMMFNQPAEMVVAQASKIIQDTASKEEGFATFFITAAKELPIPEPEVNPSVAVAAEAMPETEEIYAPLPVDIKKLKKEPAAAPAPIPTQAAPPITTRIFDRMPKVALPKFTFNIGKFSFKTPKFLSHLSGWAKFFLISFVIFVLLFAANVIAYTIRKHHKVAVDTTSTTVNALISDMNNAESALIYRNQNQAQSALADAQTQLASLKNLDTNQYNQYQPRVSDLASRVNHITIVDNPKVLVTLKSPATDLVRAGNGFTVADSGSDTITTIDSNNQATQLFLLNSIGQIQGLAHVNNVGNIVITNSEMYEINTTQNQFDLLHIYPGTNLDQLKLISPDRLYTLDRKNNQVLRIQFTSLGESTPTSLLKGNVDLSNVVDLGVDTNLYLLSDTDVTKYINGVADKTFKFQQPTDGITSATRIFVSSYLYILESGKKRLLIYDKSGNLQTQIMLPNSTDLRDLYVDESARNIYLLDSNKIESLTF